MVGGEVDVAVKAVVVVELEVVVVAVDVARVEVDVEEPEYLEQTPNPSWESTQQKAPIATASCATDPISPLDEFVKDPVIVFVNTFPSFTAPALSLNAWQKTPASATMADTPCWAGRRR
jgi:hypothetical protein